MGPDKTNTQNEFTKSGPLSRTKLESEESQVSATLGPKGPVVWAIDPFEADRDRNRELGKAIELWRAMSPADILPVFVLTSKDIHVSTELVAPLNDRLVEVANRALQSLIQSTCPEETLEPRLVLQTSDSRRRVVQTLLDLARDEDAQIIAVHAHRRTGLKRIGSFTEALIALSSVPILVLPPDAKVSDGVRTILFPTDFADASRKAFDEVLQWARAWQARVVLLHVFELPYQPMVDGEWGVWSTPDLVERFWTEAEVAQTNQGKQWAEEAKQTGVDCDFEMSKSNQTVSEGILAVAQSSGADFIVMATYRGWLSQMILGSVARDVLMDASSPVVILHEDINLPKN